MEMWYFRFEGLFFRDAEEFSDQGVFSSCVVPKSRRVSAEKMFRSALTDSRIYLKEILEAFPVDAAELDPRDKSNLMWIHWCGQAQESGQVEFDIWHLYDPLKEDDAEQVTKH